MTRKPVKDAVVPASPANLRVLTVTVHTVPICRRQSTHTAPPFKGVGHAQHVARDDVQAVAAFSRLGLIRTDGWPMVAAWLLDSGFKGAAVEQMAALDAQAGAWDIDPLRSDLLEDIEAGDLDDERAALLVGGTFARVQRASATAYVAVRRLARLAPSMAYPGGLIGACYQAEEFLDCDCHPDGKQDADRLEHKLLTEFALDLNPGLAAALVDASS